MPRSTPPSPGRCRSVPGWFNRCSGGLSAGAADSTPPRRASLEKRAVQLYTLAARPPGRDRFNRGVMPEKLRVLRAITRLNIGGPAIHAILLTRGLQNEQFSSVLVTGLEGPREG